MARTHGVGATASIPIEAVTADVAAWADDIVAAVAEELLQEARKNAESAFTNRTGRLKRSIKKAKSKYVPTTTMVKASDPKAHLIEHGHKVKVRKDGKVLGHAAARPFLGPAAEMVRERLPEIVTGIVGDLTVEVKK